MAQWRGPKKVKFDNQKAELSFPDFQRGVTWGNGEISGDPFIAQKDAEQFFLDFDFWFSVSHHDKSNNYMGMKNERSNTFAGEFRKLVFLPFNYHPPKLEYSEGGMKFEIIDYCLETVRKQSICALCHP